MTSPVAYLRPRKKEKEISASKSQSLVWVLEERVALWVTVPAIKPVIEVQYHSPHGRKKEPSLQVML